MRTTAGAAVYERVRTTTFPRQIQAAPAARRFVREAAAGHLAADDAVLLAAELIANSVVHALDATTVTVTVAVSEAFIRVLPDRQARHRQPYPGIRAAPDIGAALVSISTPDPRDGRSLTSSRARLTLMCDTMASLDAQPG